MNRTDREIRRQGGLCGGQSIGQSMKTIQLLNKIAKVGIDRLDPDRYTYAENAKDPDAILVRSASLHEMEFGKRLLAVARAGAGVNNIPIDRCSENGIVVFNTPGANANAVKELAICALLLSSRGIFEGISWARSLVGQAEVKDAVEAGKSKFAGHELAGKTLGVIGLGAIGGLVANAAVHLEMNVIGCDPYLSVDAAWSIDHHVNKAKSFEDIFKEADYITLHVPATKDTKNMICAESIAKMKDGVRIINLARADLVCAEDLKAALASGKVGCYVTDFPTDDLLDASGVIAIPHLGASTEEAEENCAVMAVAELDRYLTDGTIKNSVNYPDVGMARSGDRRLCILHANIPAVISGITALLSEQGVNIENMINRSKGQNAYTVLDITGDLPPSVAEGIGAMEAVHRVRLL